MRIVLANVPHPAIGSRSAKDHLPPLGLLAVGGPLIDAGHDVRLIDADRDNTPLPALIRTIARAAPDAVLFGHSGSASAHPVIAAVARGVADVCPGVPVVYGGVYPTYHWREILTDEPYVTAIVRGEGEETIVRLMAALERAPDRTALAAIRGLAFRGPEGPFATRPAPLIRDLESYRVGWELIDPARYRSWGGLRAVAVQFSRGCPQDGPHCGQHGFWTQWRHRDPVRFAQELAWLHREHGVRVITFADETPSASRAVWRTFLEALIAENVDLILVGSTRADDIVRDADLLPLYKQAGWTRFLLAVGHTGPDTRARIGTGGSSGTDRAAIRLLRQHGILSMATSVVGCAEERDRDHWRGLRRLLALDPDQIQMLYVTPHRWTPFARDAADRRVIQTDRTRWDGKHQVLDTRHMAPWRVLLWVKLKEAVLQGRPRALARVLFHPDPGLRRAMRWYTGIGFRMWIYDLARFMVERRTRRGPTLAAFQGTPHETHAAAMETPAERIHERAVVLIPKHPRRRPTGGVVGPKREAQAD
ncbi:radical SAM protein [Roseospira marina]|uniref:Radical SAM protein n=1 Tax=Roseospira marina TaxID=140057 RepID=A0A5M6I8W9_9PROT|nr:cobalamin-dependent protein [Roseospira marina]KAA5604643.1 radical SAM protein [Roseospira marina]MBB4315086.1 anaerobic magnesium-protoporphyrin IX monomethyl ester cyclase [Roseospira marina]MBB5088144.1 anaerobic magnesium-protoporphyrin IX monomethyl ester cyclase [Roseospira marina]